MGWRVGILTASDKGAKGERKDASGQVIRELIEEKLGGNIVDYRVVPDEMDPIMDALIEMSDDSHADLILTTGGTGLAIRDITPEATLRVIDRNVPGIVEAMRSASLLITKRAMLSRAVSGIRGRTLIINLPGSPKGAYENLEAVIDQIPHALQILTDQVRDHEEMGGVS